MGHVVLSVERVDDVLPFYREMLGFRVSDYYFKPFPAYFMHVNPRHHSLAFIQSGKNAVHHMMMELFSFDDVGQGYDIAQTEEGRVAVTLGRHTSDYLTSFYSWTPSAFMVEYGWGGRLIDPPSWQAYERSEGPSMWGHDRSWLPPEQREAARRKTREIADGGYRKPVQVMDGNFDRMAGVCPWWDSVKASAVG
jgi:catechol 2,3-dioxygenase-like lactoylglutathione lyase family enzyme